MGSRIFLLVFSLVSLLFAGSANADCCYPFFTKCGDCSAPTPYCGHGPCDIFGCNCDGGCRTGPCERSEEPPVLLDSLTSAEDSFRSADVDGDRKVSFGEFVVFASASRASSLDESLLLSEFEKLDKNRDGSIESTEFDSSLVASVRLPSRFSLSRLSWPR